MSRAVVQTRMDWAQVGQNGSCARFWTARPEKCKKCRCHGHLHDRTT